MPSKACALSFYLEVWCCHIKQNTLYQQALFGFTLELCWLYLPVRTLKPGLLSDPLYVELLGNILFGFSTAWHQFYSFQLYAITKYIFLHFLLFWHHQILVTTLFYMLLLLRALTHKAKRNMCTWRDDSGIISRFLLLFVVCFLSEIREPRSFLNLRALWLKPLGMKRFL